MLVAVAVVDIILAEVLVALVVARMELGMTLLALVHHRILVEVVVQVVDFQLEHMVVLVALESSFSNTQDQT
jgi:hypothetical protein